MKRERSADPLADGPNKLQRGENDSVIAASNGSDLPTPSSSKVRKGTECPYLDTIARQVQLSMFSTANCAMHKISCVALPAGMQNLDFDFEKCCVVSLSPINVYACLVCGKYFQVSLLAMKHCTVL